MGFAPHEADEGPERSIERWSRGGEQAWTRWRESLLPSPAADALMPLRAVLSGLIAFRHLDHHLPPENITDFRPRLRAVHAAYGWALDLISQLRSDDSMEPSLRELEDSLLDGLRVSERLLGLPTVDADAFESSCDLVLRVLPRGGFFIPPNPLDLDVRDGVGLPTVTAFVTLLRSHRFLGIAEAQIGEHDGLDRAHVVVSAVRRELRSLTRFLLSQEVEPPELRDAVEALALRIDAKVRSALDDDLAGLYPEPDRACPAERMRAGIQELRATLKDAAKQLRSLDPPAPARLESERVRKSPQQDIWAFRFILRAFIAKASVPLATADDWNHLGTLDFVDEFVRHFRVFGPRLIGETEYPGGAALMRAVDALRLRASIRRAAIDLAMRECTLFVEHLDEALASLPSSLLAPFDKHEAAADLRAYLCAARSRAAIDHAAAGAFGLLGRGQARAG